MKYLSLIAIIFMHSTTANADDILTYEETSRCLTQKEQLEQTYNELDKRSKTLNKEENVATNLETDFKSIAAQMQTAKSELNSCNLIKNQSCQQEAKEVSRLESKINSIASLHLESMETHNRKIQKLHEDYKNANKKDRILSEECGSDKLFSGKHLTKLCDDGRESACIFMEKHLE